jgi:hypothetical protein
VFNQYSDNIYFALSSERANIYLDGGAVPSSKETTQYLLRNEALGHLDALTAELTYLIKQRAEQPQEADDTADLQRAEQPQEADDTADLQRYLAQCIGSFDEYLALAPARDLESAIAAAANVSSKNIFGSKQ